MRKLFRHLFLVKEIISREGVLHFQRWRLLQTPWFGVYIHYIAESDKDKHPHSHPWDFITLILKGGYWESLTIGPYDTWEILRKPFSFAKRNHNQFHKISLLEPTWSLVFVGQHKYEWGYLTENGVIPNEEYRKLKHEPQAPLVS